jgi:hypothetical protein
MLKAPKSTPFRPARSVESLPSKPIEHVAYVEALKTYLAEQGQPKLSAEVDKGRAYHVEGFLLGEIQAAQSRQDAEAVKQLRKLLRASNQQATVSDREELRLAAQAAARNLKAELELMDRESIEWVSGAKTQTDLEQAVGLIGNASAARPEQLVENLELAFELVHQRCDVEDNFLAGKKTSEAYPNMAKKSREHQVKLLALIDQLRIVRDYVYFRLLYPERAALANPPDSSTSAA